MVLVSLDNVFKILRVLLNTIFLFRVPNAILRLNATITT